MRWDLVYCNLLPSVSRPRVLLSSRRPPIPPLPRSREDPAHLLLPPPLPPPPPPHHQHSPSLNLLPLTPQRHTGLLLLFQRNVSVCEWRWGDMCGYGGVCGCWCGCTCHWPSNGKYNALEQESSFLVQQKKKFDTSDKWAWCKINWWSRPIFCCNSKCYSSQTLVEIGCFFVFCTLYSSCSHGMLTYMYNCIKPLILKILRLQYLSSLLMNSHPCACMHVWVSVYLCVSLSPQLQHLLRLQKSCLSHLE